MADNTSWQWIPPTIAALGGCTGLGMFLWRVQGSILKDIRNHLNRVNGHTQKNTADIAAIKATCKERDPSVKFLRFLRDKDL